VANGLMQVYLESVDSTNDLARRLLPVMPVGGMVMVAWSQTNGRGRLNRRWESPMGGLYYTRVVPSRGITPLSVAHLVQRVALKQGVACQIEWPNDLIIGHRKWGGILIEQLSHPVSRVRYDMIGIGLNLNTGGYLGERHLNAISAQDVLGYSVSIQKWATALTEEFECQ